MRVVKETDHLFLQTLKICELTSENRFKICAGNFAMSAGAGSTCEEDFTGLCELCDQAAEVECAACGPVRLNKTGALELTTLLN